MNKEFDEAIVQLSLLRKQMGDEQGEVGIKIGLIYTEQKKWSLAKKEFLQIVEGNPKNYKAWYYLGTVYEELGNLPAALDAFRHVAAESELFPQSQIHLGYLYDRSGDRVASKKVIQDALQIKNKDLGLYRFLASLYEKEKNYKEAIVVLNQALAISPGDEDTQFYLGIIYDKAGQYEESIKAMQAVLKINPKNADALNYIGYTYADRDINLDEAEKIIKEALTLKPNDGYIMDSLGWVYYKKGQYEKAMAELLKAVKYAPQDPVIAEHLGDAYLKNNLPEKAIEMYDKSLKLDPSKEEVKKKLQQLKQHEKIKK
jgi:tetratricopeptide (TPR) repeat protein